MLIKIKANREYLKKETTWWRDIVPRSSPEKFPLFVMFDVSLVTIDQQMFKYFRSEETRLGVADAFLIYLLKFTYFDA